MNHYSQVFEVEVEAGDKLEVGDVIEHPKYGYSCTIAEVHEEVHGKTHKNWIGVIFSKNFGSSIEEEIEKSDDAQESKSDSQVFAMVMTIIMLAGLLYGFPFLIQYVLGLFGFHFGWLQCLVIWCVCQGILYFNKGDK